MLAPVYPIHKRRALVRCCRGGESTEEIERGEDEEGEGHALGICWGVGCGEVGAETAEPVFGVEGFVEGGIGEVHVDGGNWSARGENVRLSWEKLERVLHCGIR